MAGSAALPEDSARRVRLGAATILAVAAATILGALAFEHGLGLAPCKLCLVQRIPYYLALPVAAATLALAGGRLGRAGLALLGLAFVVSAGLGAYHAGVEWGVFAGPADCASVRAPQPADVGAFLDALNRTRVVSCTEAAWRFLGLSLAGWNVVVSLALAAVAGLALRPPPAPGT